MCSDDVHFGSIRPGKAGKATETNSAINAGKNKGAKEWCIARQAPH